MDIFLSTHTPNPPQKCWFYFDNRLAVYDLRSICSFKTDRRRAAVEICFKCNFWLVLRCFKRFFVFLTNPSLPQTLFCSFRTSRLRWKSVSCVIFDSCFAFSNSLLFLWVWPVLRSLKQSFARDRASQSHSLSQRGSHNCRGVKQR